MIYTLTQLYLIKLISFALPIFCELYMYPFISIAEFRHAEFRHVDYAIT